MTDRYDEQTVLAYIEGDLPEAEAHAFKLKMLTDSELRSLVEGLEADRATLRSLPLEQPPIDLMDMVNDQLERQLLLGGDAEEDDRKTGHRRLRLTRVGSYLALAAMFILGVGLLYQAMVDMTGEATFNDRGLVAFRDVQREGDNSPTPGAPAPEASTFKAMASDAAAPLPDETSEIAATETRDDEAVAADAEGRESEGNESGGGESGGGERPQLAMARQSTAANERMNLLMDTPVASPAPAMRARGMRQEAAATAKRKDSPEALGALAMEASPSPTDDQSEPAEPMVARLGADDDAATPLAEAVELKIAETIRKAAADKEQVIGQSERAEATTKTDAMRMAGVSATAIDTLRAAEVIVDATATGAPANADGIAKMIEPATSEPTDGYRDSSNAAVTMAVPAQAEATAKGEMAEAVSALAPQAKPAMPPVVQTAPRALASAEKHLGHEAEADVVLPQRLTVLLDTDDMERTFGRIAMWATRHKVAMQVGQSNEAMDVTDITVVVSPDQFRVLLNSLARDKRHTARIASSTSDADRSELLRHEGDDGPWRSATTWLKEKRAKESFALDADGLMAVPIIIRKK